jgi:hypothetical protein
MKGRENHSWRTNAALRASALEKGLLQDIQLPPHGQSLDRNNVRTSCLQDGHKAAIHQFAVHQYGARATLPFPASFLRAGQIEFVPQYIQQPLHRIDMHGGPLAVDLE